MSTLLRDIATDAIIIGVIVALFWVSIILPLKALMLFINLFLLWPLKAIFRFAHYASDRLSAAH